MKYEKAFGIMVNNIMEFKDYRDIQYRQEGFDKFFEFHCATNDCSPDIAVEKWIADDFDFDFEKRCTMALFHGATYAGPCESMFADRFPVITSDVQPIVDFFFEHKARLLFSPDCKYRKIYFDKFMYSVGESIKPYGTLGNFIQSCFDSDDKFKNYNAITKKASVWCQWARMGNWCFTEALERFIDAPIMPPNMEFAGGKSHRAGWAFCIGRDDLTGSVVSKKDIDYLEETAAIYIQDKTFVRANFFTLETACCNYKRQHKGSRYAGCYIDEQWEEIHYMKTLWPEYHWLWEKYLEGRQNVMPHEMLFENHATQVDNAYIKDWNNSMKHFGRMLRVESYFNKEPQKWAPLSHLSLGGSTLDNFF